MTRACELCGVTFVAPAYKVAQGKGRFCSKSCSSTHTNHERTHWPWSPIIYAECVECGAVFVQRHGAQTCGQGCHRLRANRWVREHLQAKHGYKPARWQEAGSYVCRHCGQAFEVAERRPHQKHYCSSACSHAQHAHKRRVMMRGVAGRHTSEEWSELLKRWDGRCAYCGAVLEPPSRTNPRSQTRDHVVPISRGGTDYIENIVPACLRCNGVKAAHDVADHAVDMRGQLAMGGVLVAAPTKTGIPPHGDRGAAAGVGTHSHTPPRFSAIGGDSRG